MIFEEFMKNGFSSKCSDGDFRKKCADIDSKKWLSTILTLKGMLQMLRQIRGTSEGIFEVKKNAFFEFCP